MILDVSYDLCSGLALAHRFDYSERWERVDISFAGLNINDAFVKAYTADILPEGFRFKNLHMRINGIDDTSDLYIRYKRTKEIIEDHLKKETGKKIAENYNKQGYGSNAIGAVRVYPGYIWM